MAFQFLDVPFRLFVYVIDQCSEILLYYCPALFMRSVHLSVNVIHFSRILVKTI